MEKQNKPKKNHWTQSKVDEVTKKINQEIYKRNRQAPIHLKMDDLAILINDKITRRGIAKGLVFIQEDLNNNTNNAYNANFNNGNINNNNVNNNNYVRLATSFIILNKMSFLFERHFYKGRYMKDKITFEELYEAYILCLKNKKEK